MAPTSVKQAVDEAAQYAPTCTPHAVAQPQPIHALRLACGAQRALLPVAVSAMNIHDVHDGRTEKQTSDVRRASSLNAHEPGGGGIISIQSLGTLNQEKLAAANRSRVSIRSRTCENLPRIIVW